MPRFSRPFGIVQLVASGACVSALTGPDGDRLKAGAWGGEHVALTVTDAGAHVEFDCASGNISQPVTIDADGRFAADGVYVPGSGGPVHVDQEPDRKPARYTGRLSSDTLTFDVTLVESNETVGRFAVVHGVAPRLRKCR